MRDSRTLLIQAAFVASLQVPLAAAPNGASAAEPAWWDPLSFVAVPHTQASIRLAQLSDADMVVRIERLEEEIRRLTGAMEQLQYRTHQLEQQLRYPQQSDGRPHEPARPAAPGPIVQQQPDTFDQPPEPATASGRSDAFDPSQNPAAPGAPRPLGTLPGTMSGPSMGRVEAAPRVAGSPLDLTTPSGRAMGPTSPPPYPVQGALPPSPTPYPNDAGVQTVMAPSATPKDEYDLAYGYILHKDYGLAETSFRSFLRKYPGDRLAGEANYWLGEVLFQRQRYRDAAEAFLTVSTRYETLGKAPDALLRLGQSLAALGEKDSACATFSEVGRKYPRASVHIKQGVEREQKRSGC
jgi:tol-pal system protein YbgF